MPTDKDYQFLQFVIENTKSGKLRWDVTADPSQFVASFKGKYKVTIDRAENDESRAYYYLTLLDDSERELTQIYSGQNRLVSDLFDLARRNSLNVDAAIDEIMGEGPATGEPKEASSGSPSTDEDIPF